ncbi:hypothetical protein [Tsukamurella strandjordii]|uniref:Uncharacterized protein n=1 Tax=Tsukamurella strandjordii TaxID=147577 RepID=A0AA90N9Z5_9ACTN|nr:hypothetical protein [Tsukamurella strandjordii]MDP0397750.1 hypothetical protein [Tsukamurella strandjordii]
MTAALLLVPPGGAVNAEPVSGNLTLDAPDFPVGSTNLEVSTTIYGISLTIGDGGPACQQATDELDVIRRGSKAAGASARRGDQRYESEVADRPVAAQAARQAEVCPNSFPVRRISAPDDLKRLSPNIFQMRSATGTVVGMTAYIDIGNRSIETSATSREFREDASTIKDSPVDTAGFWLVLRNQIAKVERAR